MKELSSFISWLFLPLFTPIYGLLLVLYLPIRSNSFLAHDSLYLFTPEAKLLFILLFFVFIVFAPSLSLGILKMNKSISSFQLEKAEERHTPIAIMTFYLMVLYFFLFFQAKGALIPSLLKAMVLAGGISTFCAYFITKKMKISLHALGMGALFGFIYMYAIQLEEIPILLLCAVLILGGIVLSARLILKAHVIKEVGFGYLLGLIPQIIIIYLHP